MVSVVFVRQSVFCPHWEVSHVTITHDALDVTVKGPLMPLAPAPHPSPQDIAHHITGTPHIPSYSPSLPLLEVRPHRTGTSLLLVTSGGHDWIPVQTWSPDDRPHQC